MDPGARTAQPPWWRDRGRRTRTAVVVFAGLALAGMLLTAVHALTAGDRRVVVVTMEQGAGQQAREALKQTCGTLPGVRVVEDRGDPDPRLQGRFPVRFDIAGVSTREEAALAACLDRNRSLGIRTFETED